MQTYKNLSEFKKEMRRFFYEYRKKLGINSNWKISIEVKKIPGTWAEVEWDYPRRRFWVFVNEKKNRTDKELKDSIIHELIHIVLMPYTNAAEQIAHQMHKDRGTDAKVLLKALENKEEAIVRKVTAIIMGLEKDV